jgi:Bifunctional DNA primase/polymerase, N-terminal
VNEWADFWRYQIGVNVIPANTKEKTTWIQWSQYQANPIREEQHEQWKEDNAFKDGMAVIPGKVWHNAAKKSLYLVFLDLDNQKAIEEFCSKDGIKSSLDELSKHLIIEQHSDDPTKAHAYCYSTHPFVKKSSDRTSDLSNKLDSNDIPAIEVKGLGEHGISYCTPSPHKNGCNYEIIGTTEPETIDDLELHIDNICKKYGIPYLSNGNGNGGSLPPIQDLFKENTKVYEGHNRHEALLRVMESLLARNKGILASDQIRKLANEWNQNHCSPQLSNQEEDNQWKAAIKFIERQNQENEGIKQISSNNDNNGNGHGESSNNQFQTNASILVEIAKINTKQFFKDQYGTAFAVVRIVDHDEIISIESSKFKRLLSKLFYDSNDHGVAGTDSINSVIQILHCP